ncbi:MAG: DNA-3-methyladenine glycosylase [Fimbriimonadaceae bacterium]|nr:DNA-3-methyladenine glycosylase [Fimbriimonadaceae bacterium]QYK55670.1 MAG: DNA-3-methyladenine glycosylase [Fimbriimonadaceae bacterium]
MSTYRSTLRTLLAELPVEEAAPHLLGAILRLHECSARIVEVEAYAGERDPGSHAWRGRTPRNQVMYGPPGYTYVYFTYGNHWMLNVTAAPAGVASALLIRAAQPLTGLESMRARRPKAKTDKDLLSGPGKLAAAFGIDSRFYAVDLLGEGPLVLEPGPPIARVVTDVRVGLSAGRGESTPWRFLDADSLDWASRPLPRLRLA